VLGIVLNLRAAKLVHLSALVPSGGHRTRRGAFLSHSDWDAPALLHEATTDLLASMKPQSGETVYLILDDTRLAKRGSKMGWVSKIWDHKQQKFVKGHVALTAAIAFRGVVMPLRIELWKPKGHPGPRYRKLTNMAAEMIKALQVPAGVKVRVLFDAFYLCPTVTKACESKGFTFFSVAARNRNFTSANGKRRQIATLMPGLVRHEGRNVRMKRSRGTAALRIACRDGRLSRIGRVRMVVATDKGSWRQIRGREPLCNSRRRIFAAGGGLRLSSSIKARDPNAIRLVDNRLISRHFRFLLTAWPVQQVVRLGPAADPS